jgi:hypothetical protein
MYNDVVNNNEFYLISLIIIYGAVIGLSDAYNIYLLNAINCLEFGSMLIFYCSLNVSSLL